MKFHKRENIKLGIFLNSNFLIKNLNFHFPVFSPINSKKEKLNWHFLIIKESLFLLIALKSLSVNVVFSFAVISPFLLLKRYMIRKMKYHLRKWNKRRYFSITEEFLLPPSILVRQWYFCHTRRSIYEKEKKKITLSLNWNGMA